MNVEIDMGAVLGKIQAMKKRAVFATTSQALADLNQYTPMNTGALMAAAVAHSVLEDGHIEWVTPYAHNLHEGIVYGPNYPITVDGAVLGFYSPPRKKPTGRRLKISKSVHAKATSKWTMVGKRNHVEAWRRKAEKAMGGHV